MKARIEVYRDSAREWRSRIRAANKQIVADSAEGYKSKGHAVRMAKKYFNPDLPIIVEVVKA